MEPTTHTASEPERKPHQLWLDPKLVQRAYAFGEATRRGKGKAVEHLIERGLEAEGFPPDTPGPETAA